MKIISPKNKQPFQRDNTDNATIALNGIIENGNKTLKIIATPINGGVAYEKKVTSTTNEFLTYIRLEKGLYEIKISNNKENASIIIAVGDIYTIIGHSFTVGWGANYCKDERVIIPASSFKDMTNQYYYTDTAFISLKDFSESTATDYLNIKDDIEFWQKRGIWGKLGDLLASKNNCPVAFINAGFGGSTLKQWELSALKQPFAHSFVDSSRRMPIIKLLNVLKYIIPQTGIKRILCIHGDNDMALTNSADEIAQHYKTIIDTARLESNLPNLPFMLATSATDVDNHKGIVDGTLMAIEQNQNVVKGPDIYKYGNEYRLEDKLHLNLEGETKAAEDFAELLVHSTNEPFSLNRDIKMPIVKEKSLLNMFLLFLLAPIIFIVLLLIGTKQVETSD
ncbi:MULTISPECIES: sialate O-acetylesterase [Flectobacillus]|uniref:sialate O-acetylesterase n=1 Tax=Flectobacillus TaxID=101 RepID=UPI000BA2CAF5|nr:MULTISPECIES: sialate O-acetylesterase [Flectobacillus]MDI9872724.1 sialate O-acetylesterase [Flectobacillus roseus]PAC33327.1 hypothetical protein BWI92_02125 [Flectobacillus sp. BAB-3569]